MISYPIGTNLYLNITNRCPNKCSFCIRDTNEGVGFDLWLEQEPTLAEISQSLKNATEYDEIVFCGYGEPLVHIDTVIAVARELKKQNLKIRVNTNGLANLIHGRNVVPELAGLIDTISISLNAENGQKYQQLCQSQFGEESFQGVLDFTRASKKYIPHVILSVVDTPDVDIAKCRKIAKELGTELRVRTLHS